MVEQIEQQDPIEKLYNTLSKRGYYTKSIDEFKKQYSTPDSIDKLYGVVNRDGLYTKTKEEFYQQYYPSTATQQPEVKKKVGGISYDHSELPSEVQSSLPQNALKDIQDIFNADELSNATIEKEKYNLKGDYVGIEKVPDEIAKAEGEKAKQQLIEKGYDENQITFLKESLKDFPFDANGVNYEQLVKESKDNPESFSRTVSAYKWQTPLMNAVREKDPDAEITIQNILSKQAGGNYFEKRMGTRDIIAYIDKYITNEDQNKKLKEELINDRAFSYGADSEDKWQQINNDPRYAGENGMNKYQIAALHFLEDTNPQKAKIFERLLDRDLQSDSEDFKIGRDRKSKDLEDMGMALEKRAVEEKLTTLQNKKNNGQATQEDVVEYEKVYSQYETLQEDIGTRSDRHPYVAKLDADKMAQEAVGQRNSAFKRFILGIGEEVGDVLGSVDDAVLAPFRSSSEKAIDDLEDFGAKEFTESAQRYRTSENQVVAPDSKVVFSPVIEDEIKNVVGKTVEERIEKARDIILANPGHATWEENPDAGKVKLSAKTIGNTISDVGSQIIAQLGIAATTGGLGNISKARRIATLFGTTFATTYTDYYTQAIRNNIPNPHEYATKHSVVEASSELINDDLSVVRKMAKPKTILAKILGDVSQKQWDGIVKTGAGKFSKVLEVAKRTAVSSTKISAKETFEEEVSQVGGNLLDRSSGQKVGVLEGTGKTGIETFIGTFPLGLLGAKGQLNKLNTEQKDLLIDVLRNKDRFLKQLDNEVSKGTVDSKKADDIRIAINKAEKSELSKEVDNAILSDIKKSDKISDAEKDADIDYFITKAGEAPLAFKERFGEEIFDQVIPKVSDKTLNDEYVRLAKIDPNSPEAMEIDKILGEREDANKAEEQVDETPEQSIEPQVAGAATAPPITPPTTPPPVSKKTDDESGKKKSLANRLVDAVNLPEHLKEGIREKGLTYEPKSQKDAQEIAKAMIELEGIDQAVLRAKAQEFGGDVNTLIQTEALNQLAELESKATTQKEKTEYATRFAEIAVELDEWARSKAGRGISALAYFYKQSPLGMQLVENKKRKEDFEQWAKPKDKSWKEFFSEMMKEPEFADLVKEEVKSERAAERKTKKDKVHKAIDDTLSKWAKKLKAPGTDDAAKSGIDIDTVLKVVGAAMKKAYDAGEAVTKVVQDAIDYISQQLGHDSWDKDAFRQEAEKKLQDKGGKRKLTDEEVRRKMIDKFKKKLQGLSDKEKEEVVKRAFTDIVNNGGLNYDDFRKIISDITGRGDMSDAEAAKLKELVNKTNEVDAVVKKAREVRTEEALIEVRKAQLEAGKAARELQELLSNKPDIIKRLTSIMQLNTLGVVALINNPVYNIFNQLFVRFPVGAINDVVDRIVAGAFMALGKNYEREYNTFETQAEFFKKLGVGAAESAEQLITGLNRADYTQKEIYGQQIRPSRAMRDLWHWKMGKKKLSQAQVWDKAIQATVGIPAEAVARLLNIGDKPQRFGAEGAQASAFAKSLGLKGIDYKYFIEFPREEAYDQYKKKGMSDKDAAEKADFVKEAIIKEGQRSTFQQDNMLNDLINRIFGNPTSGSGVSQLAKATLISPFIKIPINAFWSFYNLVNPEVAMLQSMVHGARAAKLKNKDATKSRLQLREARYWGAHAMVGIGIRAVILAMMDAGIFIPGNDDDDTKKEREGEAFYEQQGAVNVTKLKAWLRGEDPSKIEGGLTLQNRWFGGIGAVGNTIARKHESMTPEQKENQQEFWNTVLGGLELEALKDLQQGVFSNTSSLLSIFNGGSPNRYGVSMMNMVANIMQPATAAQINRARLQYVPSYKADSFTEELKQSFQARGLIKGYPPSKVSIWGDPIPKRGSTFMKMAGVSKVKTDNFGQPIYKDYKTGGDIGFFPPAVMPTLNDQKLNAEQQRVLETYVGRARKEYVEPYINDAAELPMYGKYSEIKDVETKKKVLSYLYQLGRYDGIEKFVQDYPEFKKAAETEKEMLDGIYFDVFKTVVKYQK